MISGVWMSGDVNVRVKSRLQNPNGPSPRIHITGLYLYITIQIYKKMNHAFVSEIYHTFGADGLYKRTTTFRKAITVGEVITQIDLFWGPDDMRNKPAKDAKDEPLPRKRNENPGLILG